VNPRNPDNLRFNRIVLPRLIYLSVLYEILLVWSSSLVTKIRKIATISAQLAASAVDLEPIGPNQSLLADFGNWLDRNAAKNWQKPTSIGPDYFPIVDP
jgi:hypothetical protein